ncbi:MAG: uracil-DNA glycosylase family protein [Alphaproteobacteria bacterium]|nr:uracil-DNA glycosylase family protein [Alphaproteobacteria bacterium]
MTAEVQANDEAVLQRLLAEVRACTVCAAHLPLGPLPVVRGSTAARIMIISQAPGTAVHKTGLSFNDPSGDRLRGWLDVDRDTFYDEQRFAMLPMGFCYPGRFERGGDRPPRPECAPLWHDRVRSAMPAVELHIVVGSYAINNYLATKPKRSMTDTVRAWRGYLPDYLPLPHPSWRTTAWERNNPWFIAEVVPELRARVRALL